MGLSREAYQALQSIVGVERVSDDPAVTGAERRAHKKESSLPPACVILPESAEEVQAIIRVCNRYMLPFSGTVTNPPPGRERENVVYLDLRMMLKLEIDEENLYATVEPGVSFTALQGELFKRGLMTFVPGSGGNCSVLANTINIGEGPLSYRLGDRGYRRILAVEWVTPEGEMLRLGSRATSKDFFGGDGPGPDLRGLLTCSSIVSPIIKGVITKIGVRIFPFISEKLVPSGDSPGTTLLMPANRFKWYNIIFPTKEAAIDAMYELSKCEIGLVIMTVPPSFFAMARVRAEVGATGLAGFLDYWNNTELPIIRQNPQQMTVRILLYGIGADKRLAYEEKVLLDVCDEFGGSARPSKRLQDETNFMSADAIVSSIAGGGIFNFILFESMDHGLKSGEIVYQCVKPYIPPVLEDYGTTHWIVGYEMCHLCKNENIRNALSRDDEKLDSFTHECQEAFLEVGGYPGHPDPEVYGAAWGNFPEKNRMFKQMLDPNNLTPDLPTGGAIMV